MIGQLAGASSTSPGERWALLASQLLKYLSRVSDGVHGKLNDSGAISYSSASSTMKTLKKKQ
jgi:hypothetical protein